MSLVTRGLGGNSLVTRGLGDTREPVVFVTEFFESPGNFHVRGFESGQFRKRPLFVSERLAERAAERKSWKRYGRTGG